MGLQVSSDPLQLAASAMGATRRGSYLNAGGAAVGSLSDAVAGMYQSRIASMNAALAERDATNTLLAGSNAESVELLKTGETVGAQKAAQAANNIDVSSGSPAAVRTATEQLGAYDAAVIHYNALRQAGIQRAEASNYRLQGGLDRMATAFNIAGDTGKVYSSFISGSTALANEALMFRQTGVPNA